MKSLIAVIAGLCSVASGQQVRYLMPADFAPANGDRLELAVRQGEGAAAAWPAEEMNYFFVRVAGTQENRRRLDKPPDGAASWTIVHDGVHTIGIDLDEREEEVSAQSLAAFLARHGSDAIAPAGNGSVTVTRLESMKSLVKVGEGKGESSTDKTSLDVDIRLLMDPTRMKPGSTLALRTYARGGSAPASKVTATHLETGQTATCETDDSAIGSMKLALAGAWRLEFHSVTAPTDEAGWRIESSTVTIEVQEAAP